MKKIITAFIFCFLCGECFSQAGEWVWIKGDNIPNQPGNYGLQGVPSPTNNPPGFYEPCVWTDASGNFWLFGGMDYNAFPYSDLWKYDLITNQWIWMKGPGIANPLPVFGTQGIPSPSNNPGGTEYGVASWIDLQGNFWLFEGYPNNLWKYSVATNEWTWIKGPGTNSDNGVYGIKGIPDPANYPGARTESVSVWTDNTGDLWFFGGAGGINGSDGLNDLWRYNINSDTWTWMKGDSTASSLGNYGTMGVEDIANDPPGRWAYTHWKDAAGNLWLFGGGMLGVTPITYFNDLWRYNPVTNSWAWMGGSNFVNSPGAYGTICNADSANIARARMENPVVFSDADKNFWLFGGACFDSAGMPMQYIKNDLWKYCVADNKWIWIDGDSISNPQGNWGVLGVASPTNKLSGRMGSVGWSDNNGNFYFFGGANNGAFDRYNDLWKYTIDTACGICPTTTGIQENNFTNELLVFPNPTNSSFTISFSSSEKQTVELRIYNTLGKQIYFTKEAITKGKFEKEINVKDFATGIYFIRLIEEHGIAVKKFVKN